MQTTQFLSSMELEILYLLLLIHLKSLTVCLVTDSTTLRPKPYGLDQWPLFPERNFRWPENKVEVLGVWISTNYNIMININFREKVDKIRKLSIVVVVLFFFSVSASLLCKSPVVCVNFFVINVSYA